MMTGTCTCQRWSCLFLLQNNQHARAVWVRERAQCLNFVYELVTGCRHACGSTERPSATAGGLQVAHAAANNCQDTVSTVLAPAQPLLHQRIRNTAHPDPVEGSPQHAAGLQPTTARTVPARTGERVWEVRGMGCFSSSYTGLPFLSRCTMPSALPWSAVMSHRPPSLSVASVRACSSTWLVSTDEAVLSSQILSGGGQSSSSGSLNCMTPRMSCKLRHKHIWAVCGQL